jgi:hypothetical protein
MPKKRVENFIDAAAISSPINAYLYFVMIDGPDAFIQKYLAMPEQCAIVKDPAKNFTFYSDQQDMTELLAMLDIFVWLSNEGMPHVIAKTGAAGLAVIVIADLQYPSSHSRLLYISVNALKVRIFTAPLMKSVFSVGAEASPPILILLPLPMAAAMN